MFGRVETSGGRIDFESCLENCWTFWWAKHASGLECNRNLFCKIVFRLASHCVNQKVDHDPAFAPFTLTNMKRYSEVTLNYCSRQTFDYMSNGSASSLFIQQAIPTARYLLQCFSKQELICQYNSGGLVEFGCRGHA